MSKHESEMTLIDVRDGASRPGLRHTYLWIMLLAVASVIILAIVKIRHTTGVVARNNEQQISPIESAATFLVTRIKDGDTIVVVGLDQIALDVRLAGIDAPELDQPFGLEAKDYLARRLSGHKIALRNVRRDKYGRVLAEVFYNDEWINHQVVIDGFAWAYEPCSDKISRAHSDAASRRIGLWSKEGSIAPSTWRRNKVEP